MLRLCCELLDRRSVTYERQGKEMVTFRVYFVHLDDVNAFGRLHCLKRSQTCIFRVI